MGNQKQEQKHQDKTLSQKKREKKKTTKEEVKRESSAQKAKSHKPHLLDSIDKNEMSQYRGSMRNFQDFSMLMDASASSQL